MSCGAAQFQRIDSPDSGCLIPSRAAWSMGGAPLSSGGGAIQLAIVDVLAAERCPCLAKVYADLVRSTRLQSTFDQREMS